MSRRIPQNVQHFCTRLEMIDKDKDCDCRNCKHFKKGLFRDKCKKHILEVLLCGL